MTPPNGRLAQVRLFEGLPNPQFHHSCPACGVGPSCAVCGHEYHRNVSCGAAACNCPYYSPVRP